MSFFSEDWTGAINYFRNLPFYRIVPRVNNSLKFYKEEDMLQLPCLLITGSKDESVQMESFIKSTEFLKTSTLRIVDNASHFPHQEQPQVVNNLLISFLGKSYVVYSIIVISIMMCTLVAIYFQSIFISILVKEVISQAIV